jgi:enoyl-CoA hydratase/carnithine racemase
MTDHVAVALKDGILALTLQRPEKKNALTDEMYQALFEGFERARQDPAIRCVLLGGSDGCFTSGNDLVGFSKWGDVGCALETLPVVRLMRTLITFDKPIVCAVEGLAIGFGTTVLMHCDLVVSARNARFQMPFVRLGLVPEFGSTLLLPWLAGRAQAARFGLLGEPFGSDEALQMGLVSHVVDNGAVAEMAHNLAQQLAALPPQAASRTKALMRQGFGAQQLNAAIDAEIEHFGECLRGDEHKQALQGLARRGPQP